MIGQVNKFQPSVADVRKFLTELHNFGVRIQFSEYS